jgi:hypothetical protein
MGTECPPYKIDPTEEMDIAISINITRKGSEFESPEETSDPTMEARERFD